MTNKEIAQEILNQIIDVHREIANLERRKEALHIRFDELGGLDIIDAEMFESVQHTISKLYEDDYE